MGNFLLLVYFERVYEVLDVKRTYVRHQ